MYSFDASSMVHAWDKYPIKNTHFESLWVWIAGQINCENFSMPEIALTETTSKAPECGEWIKSHNIKRHQITPNILAHAISMKGLLGIEEEAYGRGVGENDLLIIATAKELGLLLVSEENLQPALPSNIKNYKIPAVCALPGVNVQCIDFTDLIKKDIDT